MHVNFGLLPPMEPPIKGKRERYAAYAARGDGSLRAWLAGAGDLDVPSVRDRARAEGRRGETR
jgi:methylenetetrahydrofolate--tRNA-(uracil-5-)-methyltransferase